MKDNKAIRFLEVRNIKGNIDSFGGFVVDFETEKGKFHVGTDKLHHPEWYGMVTVNFRDERIHYSDDKDVSGVAWTNDPRLIAALAELTSGRKKEIDIPAPTEEYAKSVFEELHIPNAPGGMMTQTHIFGNADYLDRNGKVLPEREREIERFMVDSGMTREEAEARWAGSHGR